MNKLSVFISRACVVSVIIGLLILWILELNNPYFADSMKLVFSYFVIAPAIFGSIAGLLIFIALCRRNLSHPATVYILYPAMVAAAALTFLCVFTYYGFSWLIYIGVPVSVFIVSILFRRGIIDITGAVTKRVSALSTVRKFMIVTAVSLFMLGSVAARIHDVRNDEQTGKVLLLGFDGASWNVIEPMIAQGELPNLKKTMDNGSSGNLRSLESMFSPQVWASIASGKVPFKHGVYDFMCGSEDVLVKRVWEILEESGWSVGVFAYFATYPPEPVNGFMIPGFFSSGFETFPEKYSFIRKLYFGSLNFTPQGKKTSLFRSREESVHSAVLERNFTRYGLKALRYGLRLSTIDYGRKTVWLGLSSKRTSLLKQRLSFNLLIAKVKFTSDIYSYMTMDGMPDFSIYYNKIPDNISHPFWKFYEPEYFDVTPAEMAEFKNSIQDAYREIDRTIGKILKNVSENTTVLIVSDHGFQALQADSNKRLSGNHLIAKLGLQELARMWSVNYSLEVVVNYPEDEKFVRDKLRSLKLKSTGENILKIREASGVKNPQNFIVDLNDGIDLKELRDQEVIFDGGSNLLSEFFIVYPWNYTGIHKIDGIMIASGKDIKKGHRIEAASILDVTPTILTLAGLHVPEDMDGSVIEEMLTDEFRLRHPISYIDTYETGERKSRRWSGSQLSETQRAELQALGYIQ